MNRRQMFKAAVAGLLGGTIADKPHAATKDQELLRMCYRLDRKTQKLVIGPPGTPTTIEMNVMVWAE